MPLKEESGDKPQKQRRKRSGATVADVVAQARADAPAADVKPDPEAAADALSMTFAQGDDPAADAGQPPDGADEPSTASPRTERRTKAQILAENERLRQEISRRDAQRPDVAESIRPALRMTFAAAASAMASWRGSHWQLPDADVARLAEAWSIPLAPLLGNRPEIVAWGAALGVTYSVVAPRVAEDRRIAEAAKIRKGHDDEPSTATVVEDGDPPA